MGAFPASPSSRDVYVANALVSYGYGGLLGIIPPALTLQFGTKHLGMLYGILYVGVSVSEPLWNLLFFKSPDCTGVECYRTYCLSCVFGFVATLMLTLRFAHMEAKVSSNSR